MIIGLRPPGNVRGVIAGFVETCFENKFDPSIYILKRRTERFFKIRAILVNIEETSIFLFWVFINYICAYRENIAIIPYLV